MTATERFAGLVDAFVDRDGVRPPQPGGRRFGSDALTVHGRIFAMLQDGRLVVKLPAGRVRSLLADGVAGPFGAGKGRPMREWATVLADDDATWRALAEEAYAFVAAG